MYRRISTVATGETAHTTTYGDTDYFTEKDFMLVSINMSQYIQRSPAERCLWMLVIAVMLWCSSSVGSAAQSKKKRKSSRQAPAKVTETTQPPVQWASRVVSVTSQLKSRGPYSAFQLLGKPNILSLAGDTNPCSWAATIDGQQPNITPELKESLRVGFSAPVHARQVAVAENLNPGAVGTIILHGTRGEQDTVYHVTPGSVPERWRVLNVIFDPTPFLVDQVELIVYTGMVPGWNEIDAVALGTTADTIRAEINFVPNAPHNISPENLGSRINSAYDEFYPIISPDGKTLYVCRNDDPENMGGKKQDIWYSEMQPDGYWGALKNIGPPLNNNNANFVCSVLPDGNTMLVGNLYYPNGRTGPGISISYRTREGWSFPQMLVIDDFHNRGMYVNYFLAADGKTILMALERDVTYGDMDIYVSFLLDNGNWSAPLNLGSDINTAGKESTVFLAPDNRTLYFSSEGHNGYGGHDVFISRRLDESWTKWSEPQNLGPGINTPDWDAYFSIPASGEYAYFVSNSNSFGGNDIFRVPLSEALRPKPVVLMSGRVIDAKTKQPVEADIIVETLKNGREVAIGHSNPETGAYRVSLPAGELYGFHAVAPGYTSVDENIDLLLQDHYEELTRDLQLVPLEAGQSVSLNNIFFETGKWKLRPQSFAQLDRVVALLKDNPDMTITVTGHTDDVGTEQMNKTLSEKRAQAVVAYLVKQGIKSRRLAARGLGESHPEMPNTSSEARSQNRRVEFRIESK